MSTNSRYDTSVHEAGHAVMRWWRSLPATDLVLFDDGEGLCAGTGKPISPESALLVALAGPAAEFGGLVNLSESRSDDLDTARKLLHSAPWLCLDVSPDLTIRSLSVEEALQRTFERVCDELEPLEELVERLAERLDAKGRLTARTVAAICREHGRYRQRSRATSNHGL